MALRESRYEIRAGEPAQIVAPAETLDFLLHAKTRRVSIEGLVVGPNYAGIKSFWRHRRGPNPARTPSRSPPPAKRVRSGKPPWPWS